MNKSIAQSLGKAAQEVANNFSHKNREGNYKGETFKVHEIIPTSDQTAVVFFKKNTRKLGMGFFYYINRGYSKGWKYFFPTDSHVTGMMTTQFYKLEVERTWCLVSGRRLASICIVLCRVQATNCPSQPSQQ